MTPPARGAAGNGSASFCQFWGRHCHTGCSLLHDLHSGEGRRGQRRMLESHALPFLSHLHDCSGQQEEGWVEMWHPGSPGTLKEGRSSNPHQYCPGFTSTYACSCVCVCVYMPWGVPLYSPSLSLGFYLPQEPCSTPRSLTLFCLWKQ